MRAMDGAAVDIERFVRLALASVAREYPTNVSHLVRGPSDVKPPRELTPAFWGCYDWHSAVHAHWALLRIARATGSHADAAEEVDRSLSTEGLAREAKYLAAHGDFEMPYGRAWFLLLASEFARWSREGSRKDPDRLRPMADAVAKSLEAFYADRVPDPATREYDNDSWALAQLHAWYRSVGDDTARARVERTVSERFLAKSGGPSFALDRDRTDFFSPFSTWVHLVATTQPAATLAEFLASRPVPDADLVPLEPTGEVAHHLGTNWSRAWAMRALATRVPGDAQRARYGAAYEAHVRAGLRDHRRFAGDVRAYDHWVPQFAVYALTDGD